MWWIRETSRWIALQQGKTYKGKEESGEVKKKKPKEKTEQHSMRMCDAAGLDYVPTNCRRRRCFRCLRRCPLYTLEVLWFIIVNEHWLER